MRNCVLTALFVCLLASMAFCQAPPPAQAAPEAAAAPDVKLDADQVIENHLKAIGGRAAVAAIKDEIMTARLEAGGADGTILIEQKPPYKVHTKVDIAGQLIESWFDGEQGYRVNPFAGDAALSKEEIEEAKLHRFPNPLLDYKDHDGKARFVGLKKVADKQFYEVEMTNPHDKIPSTLLFDSDFMLVKLTAQLPAAEGEGTFDLEFSDYREVEGVKLPFKLSRVAPQFSADMTVESYKLNTGISDDIFKKK